jgi:DNA-binding PucR family transcriptional regulator
VGIASAWRLLHDVEIGVACLPKPQVQLDKLAAALSTCGTGRVGISPPYEDLRATAQALRLARIALHSAFDRQKVAIFDRDPLAIAAASAPDVMRRLAHNTLATLDGISTSERELLLTTFGVWLDNGGSADQAAKLLFCHANTVRHRLRRLEDRTGRSLTDPRWIAELSLAFEIDRRIAADEPD